MRFGVLGPLLVYDDSGVARPVPVAQHRRLLAILLVRANQTVSFDELADAMWDGAPPPGFRPTLRNYVRLLRQALGPELAGRLVTRTPGYQIELGEDELDMWRFARLCRDGREALDAQVWAEAHDRLTAALLLWRGPAFADVTSRSIQDTEVPHLDELRLQASEWRIEADLHLRRHSGVIGELRRLVAQQPFRERFWEQLMQALYGAGRQNDALTAYAEIRTMLDTELGVEPGPALQLLQRRILNGDPGLLDTGEAPPAPPPPEPVQPPLKPAQLPLKPAQLPPDVRGFAGRDTELTALDTIVAEAGTEPTAVVITAVSGTAGVGKTALAVHWARQVAERFGDGQLYLNLRGFDPDGAVVSPAEAVRALLDSLGLPAERIPAGVDAQTALYRTLLNGRRMLVLLDNARDADQVRPLLPGAPGCLVLVTSRDQLTGLIVADDAHAVTLDVLTEAEAVDLLVRRLGRARVDAEPAAVAQIVEACARLPLALSVVAARAAMHPGFPLASLAAELRQSPGLDSFAGGDSASDVRTVLSWSYRTLSPAAARLFRLLGLHPGPSVTAPAAASLAELSPHRARSLLAELARAHLVAEQVPGRFVSHDLLRAYATELVQLHDSAAERDAAVHRLLDHYLRTACAADAVLDPHRDAIDLPEAAPGVLPEAIADRPQAVQWFTAEHAVLLAAVGQAAAIKLDRRTAHLAWALLTYLDRQGYWGDLATAQQLALVSVERLGDLTAASLVHRSLARAYARTGDHEKALAHLRAALDLSIELEDRTGQARVQQHLAWVLELKGDYAVALKHARAALAINELLGHRKGQANALNTVGWMQARIGDHENAVASCRQALHLFEELGEGQGQAATWDSIGFAYQRQGRLDEAVSAYRRAATLLRELGDRYDETTALRHLGDVLAEAGDQEAARQAWQQALALLEQLNHPGAEEIRARLSAIGTPAVPRYGA